MKQFCTRIFIKSSSRSRILRNGFSNEIYLGKRSNIRTISMRSNCNKFFNIIIHLFFRGKNGNTRLFKTRTSNLNFNRTFNIPRFPIFLLRTFGRVINTRIPMRLMNFKSRRTKRNFKIMARLLLRNKIRGKNDCFNEICRRLTNCTTYRTIRNAGTTSNRISKLLVTTKRTTMSIMNIITKTGKMSSNISYFFRLPMFNRPTRSNRNNKVTMNFRLVVCKINYIITISMCMSNTNQVGL